MHIISYQHQILKYPLHQIHLHHLKSTRLYHKKCAFLFLWTVTTVISSCNHCNTFNHNPIFRYGTNGQLLLQSPSSCNVLVTWTFIMKQMSEISTQGNSAVPQKVSKFIDSLYEVCSGNHKFKPGFWNPSLVVE